MASRDVVDDIRNNLRCSICLDVLQDPRVIGCGHTFCFPCIEQAYNSSHLTMRRCPVCRESYFVSQKDPRNIPRNFAVNDVVETLQSAGPGRQCAICQNGDGAYICLKCKLNICSHCSKRNTINCKHQLIPFEDLNSKPFLREIIQRSKSKQVCPSHSDEVVSWFCQSCKRVHCDACHLRDHIHHNTQELQEAVRNLRARDIPGLLKQKKLQFDKKKNSLMKHASNNASPPLEIQEEIPRIESYQAECSNLHEDMCHVFMFGSDKTILELFHDRENRINEILGINTHPIIYKNVVTSGENVSCKCNAPWLMHNLLLMVFLMILELVFTGAWWSDFAYCIISFPMSVYLIKGILRIYNANDRTGLTKVQICLCYFCEDIVLKEGFGNYIFVSYTTTLLFCLILKYLSLILKIFDLIVLRNYLLQNVDISVYN